MLRKSAALFVLPLLLAACADAPEDGRVCPQAAVVRDLAQSVQFVAGKKTAVAAAARMDNVSGDCSFKQDKIVADVDVALRAFRGAPLKGEQASFPYFVALIDPTDHVVAKTAMTATVTLPKETKMEERVEKLRITLPTPKGETGEGWRILAGFQLTPEQVAFNRGEFGEPKAMAAPSGSVSRGTVP